MLVREIQDHLVVAAFRLMQQQPHLVEGQEARPDKILERADWVMQVCL
jgi:hypothetical protein